MRRPSTAVTDHSNGRALRVLPTPAGGVAVEISDPAVFPQVAVLTPLSARIIAAALQAAADQAEVA